MVLWFSQWCKSGQICPGLLLHSPQVITEDQNLFFLLSGSCPSIEAFKMVPREALRQTHNVSCTGGESLQHPITADFFQEHLILQEALGSCFHCGTQRRCVVLFAWLRHLSLFKQLPAMPHSQVWSTTALMRNATQNLMLRSMYSMNCFLFEILPKNPRWH